MSSKLENFTVLDSNTVASAIMQDIIDVESMERTLETDLSSTELFKIDCAILSSLRNTQDFSRDLLEKLESGELKMVIDKPPKVDVLENIQQNAMLDIVYPMKDMFDQLADLVVENLN